MKPKTLNNTVEHPLIKIIENPSNVMSATCFDVTFGADGFWHVLSACMEKDENKDFLKKNNNLEEPVLSLREGKSNNE